MGGDGWWGEKEGLLSDSGRGPLCTDGAEWGLAGYLTDVLGVYVCVSVATWSVKGNHGTTRGFVVHSLLFSRDPSKRRNARLKT